MSIFFTKSNSKTGSPFGVNKLRLLYHREMNSKINKRSRYETSIKKSLENNLEKYVASRWFAKRSQVRRKTIHTLQKR